MRLKSFGCSFIFGTDLADDGRGLRFATGSQLTWPALISKQMNRAYSTYSRGGSGNLQILERLLNHIEDDDTIYVIGWSWIDRFDYVDPALATPWPGTKWSTLQPIFDTDVSHVYYKNLHSEYSDKFRTLTYIKLAIDTLKSRGCKFIMTYMDELILCERWHTTRATQELLHYVRPYLSNFEGQTFLDWSRSRGFDISDMQHPLESAHAAAADLILNNLQDYLRT